jgi:hypothetical protein
METDPLDPIRQQITEGDRQGAKRSLTAFLTENRRSAAAWALMAQLVDDPAQKADCYRRLLMVDPDNQEATGALERLAQVQSQVDESPSLLTPDEIIQAAGGPLPPQEQRQCPQCGATIPKGAARCQWCDAGDSEEETAPAMGQVPELEPAVETAAPTPDWPEPPLEPAIETPAPPPERSAPLEAVQVPHAPAPAPSKPRPKVLGRLLRSAIAGVVSVLIYLLVVFLVEWAGFSQWLMRLLASGPGTFYHLWVAPGAEQGVVGQMPLVVLLINGVYYFLGAGLPALITRRRWLIVVVWILGVIIAAALAWVALTLLG